MLLYNTVIIYIIWNIRMYKISTPKKLDLATQLKKASTRRKLKGSQLKVIWVNDRNQQCKHIIGQNRCFCSHSFDQHQIINTVKPFCLVEGCKCQCYEYVPFADIRCMCRHSYKSHDLGSRMCQMCEKCLGFSTNWSCKCGLRYGQHQTVMKFKQKKQRSISRKKSDRKDDQQSSRQLQNSRISVKTSINYKNSHDWSVIDLYDKETHKYTTSITNQLKNEDNKRKQRNKIIQRINKKYNNSTIQQYQKNNNSSIITQPEMARSVTPLQLYLKPHNYRFVEVDKLLENQYKKYNKILAQITNRTPRICRKF